MRADTCLFNPGLHFKLARCANTFYLSTSSGGAMETRAERMPQILLDYTSKVIFAAYLLHQTLRGVAVRRGWFRWTSSPHEAIYARPA